MREEVKEEFRQTFQILKGVYLIFGIISVIALVWVLSDRERTSEQKVREATNCLSVIAINYGLRKHKMWVVPLILVFAAVLGAKGLRDLMRYTPPNTDISRMIVEGAFVLFWAFQIHLFLQSDVRKYIKMKAAE